MNIDNTTFTIKWHNEKDWPREQVEDYHKEYGSDSDFDAFVLKVGNMPVGGYMSQDGFNISFNLFL